MSKNAKSTFPDLSRPEVGPNDFIGKPAHANPAGRCLDRKDGFFKTDSEERRKVMMDVHDKTIVSLEEVFSPRSVAVVGVSGSGRMGFAEGVLMSLIDAGHPAIYPINPKYKEVFGRPCYPKVSAVPGPVDYVVVSIPAGGVLELLDDCAIKGVRAVQFFTAGFTESGISERKDLELEMLKKAKAGGFRIIGPNCVGAFVPKSRLVNLTGVSYAPGPIAFISQSGGHANNIVQFGDSRGLRFSKVVSYGNGLDVNEIEMFEYFSHDPETKIIAAYIEGVKDGGRFADVLKKTARIKPVVIYKGGRTEAGKRAAFGHTASMTSSIAVFDGLCRQANAMMVNDLDEMIDVLTALCFTDPLPRGPGIAMIGAGGGPSVLAGDIMEKHGLSLPRLDAGIQDELKTVLPVDGSIFSNPLDTPNMASPQAISAALPIIAKAADIDILFYHMGFHPISRWGINRFISDNYPQQLSHSLVEAKKAMSKPILLALRPPGDLAGMEEFLSVQAAAVSHGFPVFHSLDGLAMAMSRVVNWIRKSRSS
jgi:acyl-CoA synthetase (NDP forming)